MTYPSDMRKPKLAVAFRNNFMFWLMLLPSLLVLIAISYVPMFGIIVAFKQYNYIDGLFFSPWNGLKNFDFLLRSGKLGLITSNTVLYNLAFIVTGTIAAMSIAVMLSEVQSRWFKKISHSIMFLPNFMSWVIVSTLLYNIFHVNYGVLNSFLRLVGAKEIDIFMTPSAWRYLLPFLRIWKNAGFSSIIYFAAIMGIDQECYESAKLDGANVFQEIKYITLPMLVPTLVIMTLLSLGGILRGDFDMFYQLVGHNGLLYNATDIIDTYVFRTLVYNNDIGISSAAGFFQSVFCFVFIVLVNWLVRKLEPEYSLF